MERCPWNPSEHKDTGKVAQIFHFKYSIVSKLVMIQKTTFLSPYEKSSQSCP